MNNVAEAILIDGTKLPYVITSNPPKGSMKYTYFAPDKSYVIQFFNNSKTQDDENVKKRLEAIISKYNPTLSEEDGGACGNTKSIAEYFSDKFCWPKAIVKYPEFGIVCPAYPSNFFFNENSSEFLPLNGKDKKSSWFTSKNRKYLSISEVGDFRFMLSISISLARAIRRMHQAGLAHSDLSCNNVLIDPKSGSCVVIDIDCLVVPNIFPPEVIGTRGYIAPEVLKTAYLPYDDENKKIPSTYTDLHSLAVLIYEYLLLRHPLLGPKVHYSSPDEDDFLKHGEKALFIENPNDFSNRVDNLEFTIKDLGNFLENLFLKAFVNGLHNPNERPTAMEWERELIKTWDLLFPCENEDCVAKWFILYDVNNPVCPFCKKAINKNNLIRFNLKTQLKSKNGQWVNIRELNGYNEMPIFKWHIFSNTFPDEKTDTTVQAYIYKDKANWLLINQNINGMYSPNGTLVPMGKAILLKDKDIFKISDDPNGLLIEVSFSK